MMLEHATWDNCRICFSSYDGALIDLVVPGSSEDEWEAFWNVIRHGPFKLQAFRDGEPIILPYSAAWMISERDKASVMVSIKTVGVTINCHFFGGELEMDIDPREVFNEEAFESVISFMKLVASAVRLTVFALPEGSGLAFAFLQVTHDGKAMFLPNGHRS